MTAPRSGKFIVFEGGDGAGKTTQIQLCAQYLTAINIPHISTREPGGCPLAEQLRDNILRGDNTPMVELMLLMTARAAHITEVIAPALFAGKWILCDRFLDSTLAYQGAGLGMEETLIQNLHATVCADITPDLTILLDVDTQLALQRNPTARDGIEAREQDFQQRVYGHFRTLAQNDPEQHLRIDATEPIADIHARIIDRLEQ